MAKIGIVGNFGNWKFKGDGQTIKTMELYNFLNKVYENDVIYVDVDKKVNIITKIRNFFKVMSKSENIIIILSYRGYITLLPIIELLNIVYKKRIYDFVIGGSRYKVISKYKLIYKLQKYITKIYVETYKLLKEYEKIGIKNCEVIPNFKNLEVVKIDKSVEEKEYISLCTFTRVCETKGIVDAINSVKLANKKIGKNIIQLDIYGMISNDYKEEFKKIQEDFPSYIKYKGLAKSEDSVNILSKYDLMLFLTYHKGEGFPGTLIDAFASGLPIVATNWNSNEEIIEDNINGALVNVHDIEKVSNLLTYYYKNPEILQFMSKNCLKKAKYYTPEYALKKFIDEID